MKLPTSTMPRHLYARLELTRRHVIASPMVAVLQRGLVVAILLLAGVENIGGVWRNGYGNTYYAAAVKSMALTWHNFFFASFDPGGFLAVDKPPLGFWIQVVSVKLFGFSPLSLLLPEAVAGTISVALLYHLVSHAWGPLAGILAALTFALTPITVATNRNNTMDSLLVLVALLAAWATLRAIRTAHLRWLLLCAVLIACGFNIKGPQAYMVVPAFVALYLGGSTIPWSSRKVHLALAAAALVAVSIGWALAVDTIPAAQRPFVGSSGDDTEVGLMLGYNGLDRLFYGDRLSVLNAPQQVLGYGPGAPGVLRLLNRQLAGQTGWLLSLAVVGLLVAAARIWSCPSTSRMLQSLLLWGTWLITEGGFFSFNGFFHPYYLAMLTPAICALAGIGVAVLWNDYGCPGWRGWGLLAAILGTAAVQMAILVSFPGWNDWLIPLIGGLCALGAGLLAAPWLTRGMEASSRYRSRPAHAGIAAAIGIFALLIAPATWTAISVWHQGAATAPFAGPDLLHISDAQPHDEVPMVELARYLRAHRGQARYLAGVPNAQLAAPLILGTGQPVLTFGGFAGQDETVTVDRLAAMVASGTLRWFILPPPSIMLIPPFTTGRYGNQAGIMDWVEHQCRLAIFTPWHLAPGSDLNNAHLYDCGRTSLVAKFNNLTSERGSMGNNGTRSSTDNAAARPRTR